MKNVNKKLARAVVLGLMMAMPFGASAADSTLTGDNTELTGPQGSNVNIKGSTGEESVTFIGDANQQFSVSAVNGKSEISGVKDIILKGTWGGDGSVFYTNGDNAQIDITASGAIRSEGDISGAIPFHTMGGTINVEAGSINISGAGNAVFAQTNGAGVASEISIKSKGDIIMSTGTGYTVAAASLSDAAKASSVSLTSESGNISLTSEGGTAVGAYGKHWQEGTDLTNHNTVSIKAAGTVNLAGKTAIEANNGISGEQVAGVTVEGTYININGNIDADTNGDIKIGQNEGFQTANIKGDIQSTNSSINVALGNAGSLTGAISDNSVTGTSKTGGVKLDFGNGSTWNVTGESTVTAVTGTGTVILDVSKDQVAGVNVTNDNANLTVAAQQNADKVKSSEKALQAMADATNGLSDGTVFKINEGILMGESSAVMGESGKLGNITTADSTSTMGNMKSLASVAILSWRQEDSTFSQRLGELRETKEGQGIWARMSRGEFEYKGDFKNQYNYFQIGYDKAFGDWHYGAAVSYNDGETSYAEGYGENDSTSLSLYGTWLGDRGQYMDIVLKEGKLNNEYTNHAGAGTTTADYDMWGTSISAEYGQKLDIRDGWFVTPQAQLTYMRIGSENYTAYVDNNPMQVRQDALDSFVGRIGLEAGKSFSDKGSFYAKASLLHEFAGDADTYLNLNGLSNSYSQDLGDTWYECGFGVNYKITDTSYLYADVVRTFGGDIDTPWQWNLGMRWSV